MSRWVGIKAKEVRAKLADPNDLPSTQQTKRELAAKFSDKLKNFAAKEQAKQKKAEQVLNQKQHSLTTEHRKARFKLIKEQTAKSVRENKIRSARLPTGLKSLWFRVTGKYAQIKKLNEAETMQLKLRDELEMDALIYQQLTERQSLQNEVLFLRHSHNITIKSLNRDIAKYLKLSPAKQEKTLNRKSERKRRNKRQRSQKLD